MTHGIKLDFKQIDRLSEFTSNLGLVFMATTITPLFTDVDLQSLQVVSLGVFLTASCLIISLLIIKT